MSAQYNIYLGGLIVAFLISIILSIYTYRNRSANIHKYVILALTSIAVWTLASIFELISPDITTKAFWGAICYVGVATIAPFLFMFTLSYANYDKYLKKENILLLMVIPSFIIVLALTNQVHGLIWPDYYLITNSAGTFIVYEHAMGVWINLIYSYSLLLASLSILYYLLINSPKIYKQQVTVILIAIMVPFIFNIFYLAGILWKYMDITPLAFTLTVVLTAISISKYQFLDILPIAHDKLFENMNDAYLVFDEHDRLLELNHIAEKMLNINQDMVGKEINEIFSDGEGFKSFYFRNNSKEELILENYLNRWVNIQKTIIRDYDGAKRGTLIAVEDIDPRKRSEMELKENQRMLQTLISNLRGIAYRCQNDSDWTMEFVSEGCLELTGYPAEDLIYNKKLSYASLIHPEDRQKVSDEIQQALANNEPFEIVYRIFNSDNQLRFVWERGRGVFSDDGEFLALEGFITDITTSKKAENALRKSLNEKDVLLQEIHHRVKNNMQIISSLLNLQSLYSQSKNMDEIFQESQDRVKAMSLVHEKLYRSKNLEKIDFKEYITSLVSNLSASYERQSIDFKLDLSNISLDINTAIPCGLIINELVTNSIKHAFPHKKQKAQICIKFFSQGNELKLIISDNGVGLPLDFDIDSAKSLGLQLVYSLIHQLDGDVTIKNDQGTEFEITFTELKYEDRI